MKVLAMYLPQYHRIPENDKWWGEGFTDWISAKEAKPLFEQHYQPHVPLNENYYNLLDKGTMIWQAELMKKYGVDGLGFYHYWFKDGRKILEKPAENLLEWTDIDMPFFFCWANDSWSRTWDAFGNSNMWATDFKGECEGKYLLEQDYGDEKAWVAHFEYVLPFFKDQRYVKIDGKPIFHIYQSSIVPCINEMFDCWNRLAKQNDLDGIYFLVSYTNGKVIEKADAEVLFQPSGFFCPPYLNERSGISVYDYDEVWEYILNLNSRYNKFYRCGFVSFDTTPRKGKFGKVIENVSPEKFGKNMASLMKASDDDIVFVTAWNEWGEGNHLEPDEKYGYQWLEQLLWAKNNYKKVDYFRKNDNTAQNNEQKYELYYKMSTRWLLAYQKGFRLDKALLERGIKSVLIYGYSYVGQVAIAELLQCGFNIYGLIDQKNLMENRVKVFHLNDELPDADGILITPFYYFNDIKNTLIEKGYNGKILSIDSIIDDWILSER